jgi:hypothetical protein
MAGRRRRGDKDAQPADFKLAFEELNGAAR